MPWTRTSSSRHCWTICPVLGRPHPSPPFRFRSLAGRPTRAPADQPALESRVLATILSRSLLSIVFHVVHCLGVGCPFGAEGGGSVVGINHLFFDDHLSLGVDTGHFFGTPTYLQVHLCQVATLRPRPGSGQDPLPPKQSLQSNPWSPSYVRGCRFAHLLMALYPALSDQQLLRPGRGSEGAGWGWPPGREGFGAPGPPPCPNSSQGC